MSTIQTEHQQRERVLSTYVADEAQPAMPVIDMRTSALIMNGDAIERIFKFAEIMAKGSIATPDHLRGKPSDCLAVCMQATQWGMNPFAVAQKTHVVSGRLGYEAQLVNAVIQASGAIRGSFKYEFQGEKGKIECRVGAVLRGEQAVTWGEWLSEADVTTKNSPLWKTNVRQQMGYLQVKNWGRLYTPGAILGIYTPDELEDIPPARNMGEVQAAAGAIPATNASPLQIAADKAAAAGVAAYTKFWNEASADDRLDLGPGHKARKAAAMEADKNRTIDTPATTKRTEPVGAKPAAASTTTQPPATGGPVFTYAYVMDKLTKAHEKKDLDELGIAADLISEVQESQREELIAHYERMRAELMGMQ